MSLILVIEQDGSYIERIKGALAAEGWTVAVVGDGDAAKATAAKEAPDLVLVSSATPHAGELLSWFGRGQGGPGAMALLAGGEAAPGAADATIAKPFTDEQLRVSVRRCLSRGQRAAAELAAAKAASAGAQLTSQDLFGDLLAEVEEEARPKPRPAAARPATSDIDKQLQQTLSGMLEGTRTKVRPATGAVPPARPATAPTATLSAAAAAAAAAGAKAVAPAAPPPAAAPPVAPAPPAPRVEAPAPAPAPPPAAARPAAVAPPVEAAAPAPPRPAPAPPVAAPPLAAAPPAAAAAAPPRPAAPPKPKPAEPTSDVEDLLSQTLSGLGVGPKPKRATSGVMPAAAAAAAAAAASPVAPVAPRQEPPAVTPTPAREEPPATKPPAVEPPPAEAPRREPPKERGRDKGRAAEKLTPPPMQVVSAVSPPEPARGGFATMRVEPPKPAVPEQFGAYTLLDRVALGGMAEVWKARMKGVEGFQKTVAIKKILPHLTDSVDFVTMFIDEAKLAAQLNHPNIIHIYDLGKLEDDYYIAMEYVEGKDLRSMLNTARKREQPMPTGLALLVAARLASALDYAHRKRDFDNRELGLVHRDVSPQNVLISYEGDIKLCDFGIVKAVAKASKTQMGALKGKLQYMSPEQAWGRVVDARSDIFSLGSVLFEMLTGRRLFAGESEISVLEAVREARIQSVREIEPGISESVDAIVRRALAKDPDDRYQTAGEMQKELEAVLYGFKPTPSQGELAAYMHRIYGDEAESAPAAPAAVAAAAIPGTGAEVPAVAPVGGLQDSEEGARRRPWLWPVAAALLVGIGIAAFLFMRGGGNSAPTSSAAAPAAPASAAAAPAADGAAAVVPAAVPAAAPSGTAAMEARMAEQLAAQEEQLKAQLEQRRREMEAELKAQPQPSAAASVKPAPTQAAAAPAPPPVAPAPTREEPAPAPPPPAAPEPEPEPAAPAPAAAEPEPARPTINEGDFVAPGTAGLNPPAFVSVDKPEYPALAKRLSVQGVVVVSVLVNAQGTVDQARIVRGVAQKVGINEAALAAAKSARYRPATLNGVRVKTWANLSIPFKM